MSYHNDLIIRTAKGEPTERTPVWLMRQAGRILKEYRDLRSNLSGFKELVETPHLAAEVTIQPVDLLDVDAAIIFSDILVVPEAMGLTYEMIEKKGPYFPRTIETESDLNKFPIQPKGLFKQLRSILPKNSAITLDAGTLCLQATDALEYYNPPSLFTPLDFGLVGFSFACGLGVKVACPEKTVVSLMGDGGFGMTISELSTAVDYGINTITIVMNNKSWGAEKAYQKDFFGKRYLGADISSPPFDKVAKLYGAKGFKVTKTSEINQAVKAALKINKPVVIDVDVDPKALYSFRRDSFKHRIKK